MWNGLIGFYGTKDLMATDRFYVAGLGLKLYKDQGVCHIYRVSGGGMVGFCEHLDVAVSGRSPILTFLTDDVDQAYRSLKEAGYEPDHEPRVNEKFNIYHFFIRDPNGYTGEVQRFLD